MNAILKPFWAGYFLFMVLLFGGVKVQHNGLVLSATSACAVTVSSLPAKEKTVRKGNWVQKRLLQKITREYHKYTDSEAWAKIILVAAIALILLFGALAVTSILSGNFLAVVFFGALSLSGIIFIIAFYL